LTACLRTDSAALSIALPVFETGSANSLESARIYRFIPISSGESPKQHIPAGNAFAFERIRFIGGLNVLLCGKTKEDYENVLIIIRQQATRKCELGERRLDLLEWLDAASRLFPRAHARARHLAGSIPFTVVETEKQRLRHIRDGRKSSLIFLTRRAWT
jgi:hypothetical protein